MVVAELPLMMGSKYCSMSSKSIEERIQLQEDPLDLGGYFIIKGNEWSIDFMESYKFNELKLRNEVKNKLVSGFIISKNGDGFEISHQVSIDYQYKTGKIVLRLEKHERIQYVDFPFYLIFKIFGVTNHIEMTEMIT
jgi:DNA-directed RNA polymerase beta subunit